MNLPLPFDTSPVSTVTVKHADYYKLKVEQPTVLQPIYSNLNDGTYPDFIAELYYQRKKSPVASGSFEFIPSCNGGVCLLTEPGEWWLYNPNPTYDFQLIQIDAPNDALIDYYGQPLTANHYVANSDTSLAAAASGTLLTADWYRTGVIIQNNTAAANGVVRISAGPTAASATVGIQLTQYGTLELGDYFNVRERITVYGVTGTNVLSSIVGKLV